MGFSNTENRIEFREVVLQHIKRILEIATHELKDNSKQLIRSNYNETIIEEDTRVSYIQAIENLSYILLPYFDTETQQVYDNSIKIITCFELDVKKILKKTYNKICASVNTESLDTKKEEIFIIRMRLKYAKKLFIALNTLLHKNDYLKVSVFGEDRQEVIEDEEEEVDE